MSKMKRILDAMRIDPGFRVSGMRGAIEIENLRDRSRQFLPLGAGARVATRPLEGGDDVVVVLWAGTSTFDVSTPLRAADALAWSNKVSDEVRRGMGGSGGRVWPWVVGALFLLWFFGGVAAKYAGMVPPAAATAGASTFAPTGVATGSGGLPGGLTPDQYFQQELAKAQKEIDATNAARAAAGIGEEVCEAPADMAAPAPAVAGQVATGTTPMGEAPPISGFKGSE